jgi:hypothetical protein
MVKCIERTEKVTVSHHYVATLWRETGLKPHRQGTFKLSHDPRFAEKVADIVGWLSWRPGRSLRSSFKPQASMDENVGAVAARASDSVRRHAAHRVGLPGHRRGHSECRTVRASTGHESVLHRNPELATRTGAYAD